MFLRRRSPQACVNNPTDVTNPYYIAMIKGGWCGYSVSKHFMGDCFVNDVGPVWCFCRYGRSRTVLDRPVSSFAGTVLEAGTKIFIAGQHEDGSDPDFYIYNDVTVVFPNGDIKIYQYPHEVFPPTDGHSATLIGNHVWLIGSVGYRGARGKKAQVCVLDLTTMKMSGKVTTGEDPGWIADHKVIRAEGDEIELDYGPSDRAGSTVQPGSWIFHTRELRWEKGTQQKVVPENTSMDEASFRGLPDILDFWKASGKPCVYGEHAMDDASMNGSISVLDWWKASGLACKWTSRAMDYASRNGHGKVFRLVEKQWAYL
ncbi:hypothetical protein HDU90_008591 [Geranomyces variabilis]|nr:hypothetical protein HDU90_008591 [Geranomyces variabilis]